MEHDLLVCLGRDKTVDLEGGREGGREGRVVLFPPLGGAGMWGCLFDGRDEVDTIGRAPPPLPPLPSPSSFSPPPPPFPSPSSKKGKGRSKSKGKGKKREGE